ncbi:LAGLIDADG family homing endonuclease [Halegenticoccus soli]|uniref:LAGLIDADG family homing endonuclease n=1 Tax=Halegenticoccus soli TaxID=1985678 RepID=UPI000C6DE731
MTDTETIAVAEVSAGPGGTDDAEPGSPVELPVVEILTGRGFITGKSGGGKSILEGTPVHTANGRKPIEEVEEGEKVLSLNKRTYRQEFREVRATISHTDDRLLRITLEDGTELVGTEDHSFLTVDGLEIVPVRGDELEEGTWMPLSRELPSAESATEIDLAEYVDDANNIRVDGGVIQSGPREELRRLTLDFATGKEIGLYLAEGSFDSGLTLQISNVDDGVKEFLRSRGYNVYERTCNKGFRPYARFLEAEFGSGSANKRIPNWAFDAPSAFRAGLLSGYFDGDGTVGENAVAAMSKSERLVDGLKELLRQFGISSTVREKFTLYEGEDRRYRRLTVDSFCIDAFDDTVDLSVESKSERLAELRTELATGDRYNSKDMIPNFGPVLNVTARGADWTTRDSERRIEGASVHNLTRKQKAGRRTYNRLVDELDVGGRARAFGESDVQWKRVVSVERLDEERTVYDLDVELNDNFVANGVFVHNSNTASVIIENLLDKNFPVLIVDTDGEYYGLKESYEILHAGADDECDIQVSPEHAEKIAALALEQNVPIILDVSGYLDESDGQELLLEVSKQLFAKEKKLKKPFLMLVEECHEYIPEKGGVGEAGKMLIKIGKRGRKHGLGVVGISQRPADVKKDFITQCDWLVWHRLTWGNDTKVVGRILGGEYADAIEDMGNGEAFLMTDWSESVRRVQFHRKKTFDAGATPGLDDFERPELKSVSGDLVSELRDISDEKARRESELADLRQELDEKRQRIEQLERELEEARDMSRMADQFAQAMLRKADAPYRGGQGRNFERPEHQTELHAYERSAGGEAAAASDDSSTAVDASRRIDASEREKATETKTAVETDEKAERNDAPGADGPTRTDGEADAEADDDAASDAEYVAQPYPGFEEVVDEADDERRGVVVELGALIAELDPISRRMLRYYRDRRVGEPVDAHVAAGGSGDQRLAYSRNRPLRRAGLVRHAGRGRYAYALPDLVREEYADRLDDDEFEAIVAAVEATFLDDGRQAERKIR